MQDVFLAVSLAYVAMANCINRPSGG